MKRNYLLVSLACFALGLLLFGAWWALSPQAPRGQVGYIPPAPITAAPAIISPTATATVRPTWTPIPSTSTPTTAASTLSPTPTAFISPTPTLGPDANTAGDPPPTQPATGGAPANISLLAQFLLGLASGSLTFKSAEFIFAELAAQGIALDKRRKRLAAYGIAFALALGALALAARLGHVEWNPENIFGACLAAFATSQALHGALGLRPEEQPLAPFAWGK